MKRLRPALLGLTVGVLALWLFFGWLVTLFRSEREDAAREADSHRAALEAYALAELSQTLRLQLEPASERLRLVRADPLLDDHELFLAIGGAQVVPAPRAPGRLEPSADDSVLLARTALVEEVTDAVSRADRPRIERATRAFLSDRARYVLPLTVDAPLVLRVVQALRHAGPAPELLRMLLRDGVSVEGQPVPQGLEGLQRAVLRRRSRLTEVELERLCEDVSRISREASVPSSDFLARCAERPLPLPAVGLLPEGDSLAALRGEWNPSRDDAWQKDARGWLVRNADAQAVGVVVNPQALISELTLRLRERGLLSARDALHFSSPEAPASLESLRVSLEAPEWTESARRRDERFALKSLLLGISAALSLGVAAFALLAQRRKLRFVELKSDFVATVSHELRTPLASMRVMAETLERRLEGHAGAKDYPARIVREVDGLAQLVDNILSFNRLDKGRWQRKDEQVLLTTLVAALRAEAERYPAAKVELTLEGFESGSLRGDGELLQLLLGNLLRNACKYNARDPVQLRFSLEGDTLRVSDNGVGIPEGERENVFVEFNRLPGQRGRGGAGSGLGLALARRIMALHHGTIAVERSSAEGTTFVLKFPLNRA